MAPRRPSSLFFASVNLANSLKVAEKCGPGGRLLPNADAGRRMVLHGLCLTSLTSERLNFVFGSEGFLFRCNQVGNFLERPLLIFV